MEKGEFSTLKPPQMSDPPRGGSGGQSELAPPAQAEQGQDLLPAEGCRRVREHRDLPLGIEERHSPGLVVQVDPDHLGGFGQGDGDGGRSESLALAPALPHGPDPHLGLDADPALPAHGFLGHADGPGGPLAHLHLPVVPAGSESLPAQDAARRVEAFGVVGDGPPGVLPPDALPVLGQGKPGMGRVRIQRQARCGGRGWLSHTGVAPRELWDWVCPISPGLGCSRDGLTPVCRTGRVEKPTKGIWLGAKMRLWSVGVFAGHWGVSHGFPFLSCHVEILGVFTFEGRNAVSDLLPWSLCTLELLQHLFEGDIFLRRPCEFLCKLW